MVLAQLQGDLGFVPNFTACQFGLSPTAGNMKGPGFPTLLEP